MPSVARLPVLRTTLVGIGHFLAAGTVLAQELDIPLVAEPPKLADFVSMAPPEDVRSRFAVVTDFTQREPSDGVPSTNAPTFIWATTRRISTPCSSRTTTSRERARESRAAREHRERRPRRL
jgi:hypothetical protein